MSFLYFSSSRKEVLFCLRIGYASPLEAEEEIWSKKKRKGRDDIFPRPSSLSSRANRRWCFISLFLELENGSWRE